MNTVDNISTSRPTPYYTYVNHPSLSKPYTTVFSITQEIFDSAVNFQPDSSDLFICSYPKSGTTWLMNVICLMKNNGVPPKEHICNVVPFLEFHGGKVAEKFPKPRLIKTHFPFPILPFSDKVKYIYIARNPKDVVVSFYYHTLGFGDYYKFKDGKFDDYFEVFISGGCDSGDYFEVVSKWFEESQKRSNIHMMLYEDLKSDPRSEILRLAEFLGDSMKEKLLEDDEKILNDVIKHSSFSTMKQRIDNFILETRPEELPFFRKGVIGDWRNHLSRDQSERIDERMKEVEQEHPGFSKIWAKYESLLKL